MSDETAGARASIAVIGAGPRGIGWLERFAENRRVDGGDPVTVHLIDPFPPGPGRIWRYAQSPLLKLNSLAEDVTVFTDESSTIDGPVAPGPSLSEWADGVRRGEITDVWADDPALARELAQLGPKSFPTRRLQSLYLDWFYRRTLARLDEDVEVVVHEDTAVAVDEAADGRQLVRLGSGADIEADVVLYSLGHSASAAEPEHAALEQFAQRHGLYYLAPTFTADAALDDIPAGEPLIVRGLGLAAVDTLVLLGEGRAGRFERAAGGALRYLPSGAEPKIYIGSRRGIPYHSKITSTLAGPRPEPRFFTVEIAQRIAAEHPRLDFAAHIWPAIAKEMLHGYYAELFTGHPERVRVGWEEFLERFTPLDPFGDELRALTEETVVDPGDRLDLERFNRPLAGYRAADLDELQASVRAYIRDDLDRRTSAEHSATLGLFLSLLQALYAFMSIADAPNWTARSRERDLGGWWHPYFSYIASGPPGHRLEEILALSEAGVVTFLGGELEVVADDERGVFRARGGNTDVEVTARALVDAWLPPSGVATSGNPAIRSLLETGVGVEHVHEDGEHTARTGRLLVTRPHAYLARLDGTGHPSRLAIGPYTSAPFVGAFSRPRTNAVSFRENDAVAREVLRILRGLAESQAAREPGIASSSSRV